MKSSRRHLLVLFRLICCGLVLIGAQPQRFARATDTIWTLNGNGNWTTAANWNNGEPTNSTFNVFIDDGDTAVVVTLNAFRTIGDLTVGGDDAISILGGQTLQLAGGDLANAGIITINSDGVNNDSNLIATNPLVITGSGQIVLNNQIGDVAPQRALLAGTITNGATHTILGGGRISAAVTNNGFVTADSAVASLFLDGSNKSNTGLMQALNGGTLRISAITITNTDGDVTADNGTVQLRDGATIAGGNLNSLNGGTVLVNGTATLKGVTSNATINQLGGSTLFLENGLTNNGILTVNSDGTNSDAHFQATNSLTIGGTGQIVLDNPSGNDLPQRASVDTALGAVLTQGDNHTIRGRGQVTAALINNGTVEADRTGSTLLLNGASKTNNGTFRASNGATLNLSGSGGASYTNNGTFEAIGDGSTFITSNNAALTNAPGGTSLTGGTYRVVTPNGATNVTSMKFDVPQLNIHGIGPNTTVELSGDGALVSFGTAFNALGKTLMQNEGSLKFYNGYQFHSQPGLQNSGKVELGGVGLADGMYSADNNLILNGLAGEIFGHGTITATVQNHGKVRAADGTLAIISGIIDGQSGTIQIDSGAQLDLSASSGDSDTDFLIHNGSVLNLGTHNVLVRLDYSNDNFGAGNAFNPRANVFGSGLIQSDPAFTQTLSGDVTGGATATPTLNMGVVRIGGPGSTKNYVINAAGTAGATLRGAVMNNNATYGASLTNAQLSGTGATAGNWILGTGTNTGNQQVALTGALGGQGALTGQTLAIVNNFDNVAEQVLSITGEVWQPAVPNITAGPIALGNFHVGDAASSQLSIANNAVASAFSENLKATVTSNGAPVLVSGGPSVSVAPNSSNNTIVVGISTTTGGSKSGSVKITRFSSGATGLADLDLGDQTVNVSGDVYRYALPVINNLNLGDRHVGDTASGNLAVQNNATNDAFSESLRAAVASFTPDVSAVSGSVDIAPAGGSGTNLSASLSTSTAGNKSGTVTYNLTSLAHASGLSDTSLGTQQATITGKVYNLAIGQVTSIPPISFGIVHVGDVVTPIALSIKNNAAGGAFSENLDVATGTHGTGVTGGGTINDLAPQATNSTNLSVGISTAVAANISTNYVVKYTSDGTGINSLGQTTLADQNFPVLAQVNNYAVAQLLKITGSGSLTPSGPNTFTLDLGTVAQNQTDLLAELGVKNNVTLAGPADTLAGNFGLTAADFRLTGFDAFSGLVAGSTHSNLLVGLDSATPGMFTGQLRLFPHSTNSQPSSTDLSTITINLLGQVTPVPEPATMMLLLAALALVGARRRK